MKTITYIMFTYKEDWQKAVSSVKYNLNKLKNYNVKVYIADDGKNPMDPIIADELLNKYNICYIHTFFDRKKNLNGNDCIFNQTKMYHELSIKDKSDILLKIDSDTLLENENWPEEFINSEKLYTGGFIYPTYFTGACYMIKSDILFNLHKDVSEYPTYHVNTPEDYEISMRLSRLYPNMGLVKRVGFSRFLNNYSNINEITCFYANPEDYIKLKTMNPDYIAIGDNQTMITLNNENLKLYKNNINEFFRKLETTIEEK